MADRDRTLLDKARDIAKTLIERNYPQELPLFPSFWGILESRVQEWATLPPKKWKLRELASQAVAGLGFAQEVSCDYQTFRISGATIAILLDVAGAGRGETVDRRVSQAVRLHGKRAQLSVALLTQLEELVRGAANVLGYSLVKADSDEAKTPTLVERGRVETRESTLDAKGEAVKEQQPYEDVSKAKGRRAKSEEDRSGETLDRGGELRRVKGEIGRLQKVIRHDPFEEIIGKSRPIRELIARMEKVKGTDVTVLITGESGVGKELVVQALHRNSSRRNAPFMAINLAAVAKDVAVSELFGHVMGAFTGANTDKKGLFETVHKGTIFLDEIGDASKECQAMLLRALDGGKIRRVGGTEEIAVDVRVIAATNKDLAEAVRRGTFREDLYYRLNVFSIGVPPLRDRREDIPMLVNHFIAAYAEEMRVAKAQFSDRAMDELLVHDWPGNVRALRNCVQRALTMCEDQVVEPADLELSDVQTRAKGGRVESAEEAEKRRIIAALEVSRTIVEAARKLKMARSTLYQKLAQYGIDPSQHLKRRR